MITKAGNPLAMRKAVVETTWIHTEANTLTLATAGIRFTSDGYTPIGKVDLGATGFTMDENNPIPLPPAEYIPAFTSADEMLRWVLGYMYEIPAHKDQLGAD